MDDDFDALQERADALIDLGRSREAIPLLLKALAIEPDDLYILARLARIHNTREEYTTALGYADRMIEIDPDWDRGYFWRAHVLVNLNQMRPALEAAEAATRLDPDSPTNLNMLARMQQHCADSEAAVQTTERLLELAPDWNRAHFRAGWVYTQQERWPLAERHYRKALEIDPNDTDTLNNLGYVCERSGRGTEALDIYYRALIVDPGNAWATQKLESAAENEGYDSLSQYLHARQDLALRNRVRARAALLKEGNALLEKQKPGAAIKILLGGFPEFKTDPLVLDLLAQAHVAQKTLSSALYYAEAAIAAAPDDSRGHLRRARVLIKMSKTATGPTADRHRRDAAAAAEEAVRCAPEDSWVLAQLVVIQRGCKQLSAAEETAKRLLTLAPEWAYSSCHLAYVYLDMKLYRLAEMYVRQAMQITPEDPDIINDLGRALLCQERVEAATDCFSRALKLDPGNRTYDYNLKLAHAIKRGKWAADLHILSSLLTGRLPMD
jgi:tetratricopeptide (TPR) repeat protein